MSIEALLQAHIDALNANTEAVNYLAKSLYGRAPGGDNDTPKTEKKVEVKPDVKEAKEIKEEPKPEVEEDVSSEVIPYETVRALVLKLAGGGKREEIKALNAKHGIANLKVLLDKEDDFSTVNDQAKLGAVYADLLSLEV